MPNVTINLVLVHSLWHRTHLRVASQLVASAACTDLSAAVGTLRGDCSWMKLSPRVKMEVEAQT